MPVTDIGQPFEIDRGVVVENTQTDPSGTQLFFQDVSGDGIRRYYGCIYILEEGEYKFQYRTYTDSTASSSIGNTPTPPFDSMV